MYKLCSGNVFDLIGRCELHLVFSGNLLGNNWCLNVVIMLKLCRWRLLCVGCEYLHQLRSWILPDKHGFIKL